MSNRTNRRPLLPIFPRARDFQNDPDTSFGHAVDLSDLTGRPQAGRPQRGAVSRSNRPHPTNLAANRRCVGNALILGTETEQPRAVWRTLSGLAGSRHRLPAWQVRGGARPPGRARGAGCQPVGPNRSVLTWAAGCQAAGTRPRHTGRRITDNGLGRALFAALADPHGFDPVLAHGLDADRVAVGVDRVAALG